MATVKIPEGFTDIQKTLPAVKRVLPVCSISEVVTFSLANGKTVLGRVQRWDRDMNAAHIKATKGNYLCVTLESQKLENVTAWK